MRDNNDMFSLIREPDLITRELYLEELGLEPIIVKKLKDDLFIGNLGELLDKDVFFIDKVLDDIGFVTRNFKTELRHAMHKKGFVLKGEFSHLGISDELAMVPVWELGLTANTSNALLKNDLCVLGDIIGETPGNLTEILGNEHMVEEIKLCINNLGFSLQEENKKRR